MNDSMRRVAAVLLVILGGAALWWADSGAAASASANDAMVATIAARERAAANDSRLKGASRFEQGGWIYVHLEGHPGAMGAISTRTFWRRRSKTRSRP